MNYFGKSKAATSGRANQNLNNTSSSVQNGRADHVMSNDSSNLNTRYHGGASNQS